MAEQALGPGGRLVRRRAFFGLLDANGWGWAGVKAAALVRPDHHAHGVPPGPGALRHGPDTIDVGVSLKVFNPALDLTPISFCPASNRSVPCPAPAGTVLPWEPNPAELLLPAPARTQRSSGPASRRSWSAARTGRRPRRASSRRSSGRTAISTRGSQGAPLPAPRAQASAVFFSGVAYVIGGVDAGGAPTDTVFAGTPDAATGKIVAWAESTALKLPAPRAGAAVVVAGDGVFLVGGTDGKGPDRQRLEGDARCEERQAHGVEAQRVAGLVRWGRVAAAGAARPRQRRRSSARTSSCGAARMRPARRRTSCEATCPSPRRRSARSPGGRSPPAASAAQQDLPAAHLGAFGWVANGNLYYAGGDGANGEVVWAIPDAAGNIAGWQHLAASDLPADLQLRDSAPDRLGLACLPRRRPGEGRPDDRDGAGGPRAEGAVLPARPLLHRGPGDGHPGRGRPAALLPRRRRRGDRQLRAPAADRLRLQPQGANAGVPARPAQPTAPNRLTERHPSPEGSRS